MTEDTHYTEWLKNRHAANEEKCRRCGRCCGSDDGDPCAQLKKLPDGTYTCATYPTRLGPQITVKGNSFECVPIKEVLAHGGCRPGCGYETENTP